MSVLRSRPYRFATRRVLRWMDIYTSDLPLEVANARKDELASDLHEQARDAERTNMRAGAVAFSMLLRLVIGVPADLSWRRECLRAAGGAIAAAVRRRRTEIAVVTLAFSLAGGLALAGAVSVTRLISAQLAGNPTAIPAVVFWTAALTAACVSAACVLLRPTTRWVGATLLAISVAVLPSLLIAGMWPVSATINVVAATPGLGALIITASGGLALAAAGVAYWWIPFTGMNERRSS